MEGYFPAAVDGPVWWISETFAFGTVNPAAFGGCVLLSINH